MASTFYPIYVNASVVGNSGGQPHACRLTDGTMIAAVRINSPTPDTRVYRSNTNGLSWSFDGELNSTLGPGLRQVFVDSEDRVSIGNYTKHGGVAGAYYLHRTGTGTYSSLYTATTVADALEHCYFARDSQNRGHLVVVPQGVAEIRYYQQADSSEDGAGGWTGVSNELVVNSGITSSSHPVILVDENDTPHVIYYDGTASQYKHTRRLSGAWTTPVSIAPSPAAHLGDFHGPVLGIDRRSIHMAFYGGTSVLAVTPRYAKYDGATLDWSVEQIDAAFGAGTGSVSTGHGTAQSLDGIIHAYFIRDQDTAYYSRQEDGTWQKEVIDYGGTNSTAIFGPVCQPYPLTNDLPQYPAIGGHFCGVFNNGTSQALQFAYMAGSGLSWDSGGALVRGMGWKGAQPTAQLLQSLMMAYDFVMQDRDGVLTFVYRRDVDEVQLLDGDLGAHGAGEQPSDDPVTISDAQDDALPKEVIVKYMDLDRNYQISPQSDRFQAYPLDAPMQVEFPLVFRAAEARSIAMRLLWLQHANRGTIRVSLPPSNLRIREYDRVLLTAFGDDYKVIATKVDRGDNLQVRVEGPNEVVEVLTQAGISEDSEGFLDSEVNPPSEMQLEVLDFAPLASEDETRLVLYFASAAFNRDAVWAGGTIYVSSDDSTYFALRPIAVEAVVGSAVTVLAGTFNTSVWDYAHTVDVELVEGTLSSKTQAEVLSGMNRAVIGQECIGFVDATLIGTNTYRLSTLLRGLRNTERWNDRHKVGERFIYLNAPGVDRDVIALSLVGQVRYFKAVPAGGNVADFPSRRVSIIGGSMKPFAVCHEEGTRDGSNNLTITWVRRSRSVSRIFGSAAAPLLDTPEAYEIDFYEPTGTTVVRTKSASSPTTTYSAAEQTTDGYTPGNSVYIAVYQISPTIGRGRTFKVQV